MLPANSFATPQLSPGDEELKKVDGRYRDQQAQLARAVGGNNALANAGALVDDDAPKRPSTTAGASATAAAAAKRDLPNQKLGLLRALLSIGDLSHSLFILSQFPALAPANLDVCDLLLRLLSVSVERAYHSISISQGKSHYIEDCIAPRQKFVQPSTSTQPEKPPTAAPVHTYLSGRAFPDPNKNYVFFFAEWTDRLPKAGDWDETIQVLELFLPFVGVFISRDFPLYTRLCRIIVRDLKALLLSLTCLQIV